MDDRVVGAVDRTDRGAEAHRDAGGREFAGQRPSHRGIVDDSGIGCMKRLQPNGIGLDLGDLLRPDPPQPRHVVGDAAGLQVVEPAQLVGRHRDDQLAAALMADAVVLAVLVHQAGALDAQPGLERSRLVVDTAVDHPGVVAGLVPCRPVLTLEDGHRVGGAAHGPLPGHRQTDDAGSDDDQVIRGGRSHGAQSMSASAARSIARSTWARRSSMVRPSSCSSSGLRCTSSATMSRPT
jgi:hypothetical protein